MANANQVIVNGETILDLRSDTVTPATLQKGYTAHDKSGTKITGTLIATGVDTSDATAAAEDIVKNKTAYVNGTKVTGTLESGAIANLTKFVSEPSADILVRFEGAALTDGYVKADEYDVKLNVERDLAYALFGYATPADVAKGKTFTSGSGIKQTGTLEASSVSLQPSKSVTITQNGTATITPDEGYDGLSSVDVTVDVSGGGGSAEPATLTITSQSYTGNVYGLFVFVNSEGHLEQLDYLYSPFTFPINIKTVLGGAVAFIPDGFPGLTSFRNPIGCEVYQYNIQFYILVTSSQASVEIYIND